MLPVSELVCDFFVLTISQYIDAESWKRSINPFPHYKILDQTKLKAFADGKLNVAKIIISVFDRVETLWEEEKLLCFQKVSLPDRSNGVIVWEWVNGNSHLSS